MGIKYEKLGLTDTSFLYKRNPDGTINPRLVAKYEYERYNTDKMNYISKGSNAKQRKDLRDEFEAKYGTEKTGIHEMYHSSDYKALSPLQRAFYDEYMEIKGQLDDMLPRDGSKYRKHNGIYIRKETIERFYTNGAKDAIKYKYKDAYSVTTSDLDIITDTLTDFEGKLILGVPVYYQDLKPGETMDDISMDMVGNLLAYAGMASLNYHKRQYLDELEVAKEYLQRYRETTDGGLEAKVSDKLGEFNVKVSKSAISRRSSQRLDSAFEQQLYGVGVKSAKVDMFGTRLNMAKVGTNLASATGFATMSLNVQNAVANILQGAVAALVESASSEHFSGRELLHADAIYGSNLVALIGEATNRTKFSKLGLFLQKFDITQDTLSSTSDSVFDKKRWLSRMFDPKHLSFMQTSGEHYLKSRIGIATALREKVIDPNGNEVSLWEAIDVAPINPEHPEAGNKLIIKSGYKSAREGELNEENFTKLVNRVGRKASGLNNLIGGIYNDVDRVALQSSYIGVLGLLFRKWMKPAMNKRFSKGLYNYDLEAYQEGYYLTTFNFMKGVIQDLRSGERTILENWEQLDDHQRNNLRRALAEYIALALLFMASWLLGDDDDEGNKDDGLAYARYLVNRLYLETAALTPSLSMVDSLYKLFSSPTTAMSYIERVRKLATILNPASYETFAGEDAILQSGSYKGYSKAEKAILQSPLVPVYSNIHKLFHIEDQTKFYTDPFWK